jgi:hypothetical protein
MFKLEKAVILALVLTVGILGVSGEAIAGKGNGPAPHVTGSDVEFDVCTNRYTTVSFNAHEAYNGRPVKGEVHYTDENGDWFEDDVTCVNVIDELNQAIFSGQVVRSNRDDWIGKWFRLGVYDGGSPGRGHDKVWVDAHLWEDDPGCEDLPGLGPYGVLSGNLVIHPGHQKMAVERSVPSELKAGPNPFNATTQISYFLPEAGAVQLEVFNIAGQRVETLSQGWQTAGEHKLNWDAEDFISGVYFLRLTTGEGSLVRKVTLLK